MNPQKSNKEKELQKKNDIKNAIESQSAVSNNETALNDSYSSFVNSNTVPEAWFRAFKNVPEGLIRSIAWKYVKTINSILSKTLFYLGVELGSSNADVVNKAKEATKKVELLTNIIKQVLNDPEVKENVRQLAVDLNNSVLKPFLEVALVTATEMAPQIDRASDKLQGRIHNGVRKLTDSVGNGVLSGLGTVPYVGNILNATGTIANTLLGVQSVVDESVGAILDQTLETLTILQKIGGPGNKALDSWVNFALNANNALVKFQNQYDKISAAMEQKEFTKTPLKTKEGLMGDFQNKKANEAPSSVPIATEVKPTEATEKVPIATEVKPVKGKASAPVKAKPAAGGGRRKKRKKKTKKRNQKKRTKRKSRRRK